MEITPSATQISEGVYSLSWTSTGTDKTYYLYVDGALYFQTKQTTATLIVDSGESIVVQLFDDSTDVPDYAMSGKATIGWADSDGAVSYLVYEYVSGAWVERATVQDDGKSYFTWQSTTLADSQSHSFRVVSVDEFGVSSAPLDMSIVMARHPDVPDVTLTYSETTGKVAISAT